MMLAALALTLAPVFAPPPGWYKLPPDQDHPHVTAWEHDAYGPHIMFSVRPFTGTTEDAREQLEAPFKNAFRAIEFEGKAKLCNGLIADRLILFTNDRHRPYSDHVFIVYDGKLYDASYSYTTDSIEALTAILQLCPADA